MNKETKGNIIESLLNVYINTFNKNNERFYKWILSKSAKYSDSDKIEFLSHISSTTMDELLCDYPHLDPESHQEDVLYTMERTIDEIIDEHHLEQGLI